MKLHLLIDSSVWLDIVGDARQFPVLETLSELIKRDEAALILPQIVVDEVNRHRQRVIDSSRKALGSHFRQVRQAVSQFGPEADRAPLLQKLNEVDHHIAFNADTVNEALNVIDDLFNETAKLPASETAKGRAADRGVSKTAPFHRSKNSMADAILLETYVEALSARTEADAVYAFVTSNTDDFSHATGDKRLPHDDLAGLFDGAKSRYATQLGPLLREFAADIVEDMEIFREYVQEPRRLSDVLEAEQVLFQQVWYNRKWQLIDEIEKGKHRIVKQAEWDAATPKQRRKMTVNTVHKAMLKAMRKTERELGKDNLGPWDDFEWGMINGKLSALRWVLGDDWDMLDT